MDTSKNPYGDRAYELQFVLAEKIYDSMRECDIEISNKSWFSSRKYPKCKRSYFLE